MVRFEEVKKGIQAGIPILLGYIPIGIAYGMMASHAGLPLSASAGLSLFVYTGAGQMAAVGMLENGAAVLAIIFTTFILNLRHVIMSACVMQKLQNGNRWQRALLSFWITDEVFAVYMTDTKAKPTGWFLAGLAISSYLAWQIGSWIGIYTTTLLPENVSASLGISLYAMFIALIVPGFKKSGRLTAVILITALFSWIFQYFVSSSWSIIFSTLLGAGAGMKIIHKEDLQ